MLRLWKEDVKRGGTTIDKWKQIETQTYEKFVDARECLEQVQFWLIFIITLFIGIDFKTLYLGN